MFIESLGRTFIIYLQALLHDRIMLLRPVRRETSVCTRMCVSAQWMDGFSGCMGDEPKVNQLQM